MDSGQLKNSWPLFLIIVLGGGFIVYSLITRVQTPQTISYKEVKIAPSSQSNAIDKGSMVKGSDHQASVEKGLGDPGKMMAVQHTAKVLMGEKKEGSVDPVRSPAIVSDTIQNNEGFAVQVYSFQSQTRAEAALESLKSKGYEGYILMSDLGEKGIWHRVRVGAFANEEQAKSMLTKIKDDFKSGIIVRTR